MTDYIWLVLVLVIAITPALLTYLRERRLARLAKEELKMARSVTAMEELMLSGTPALGEVCHDYIFIAVQQIQRHRDYSLPWNFLRKPSAAAKGLKAQLDEELAKEGCAFSPLFNEFNDAYFRAFSYKHPWKQKFHSFSVFLILVTLDGIVININMIIGLLTSLMKIRKWWQEFDQFRKQRFFVDAAAYELVDSNYVSTTRPLSIV